jgi:hypothetical protein
VRRERKRMEGPETELMATHRIKYEAANEARHPEGHN